MNDFSKIYSKKQLSEYGIITMVFLPLEESTMIPVSQAIDLMKQGENIIYFSFNYDSIIINEVFKSMLKNEKEPNKITGNLAIIDASQIPEGMDYVEFMSKKIDEVKISCPINFVFMDILGFRHKVKTETKLTKELKSMTLEKGITAFLFKHIDMPVLKNPQDQEQMKKIEDIMNKEIVIKDLADSLSILYSSDIILSINRDIKTFWKKIINFLLFWRKKNNFAVRVLKNRYGKDGHSFRMNIDANTYKVEIL